jgi:hypothetical protein
MAVLTDKQEPMLWAIGITGMSTHRASFACVVGIHIESHTAMQKSFVGNHTLEFGKRPFGVCSVGFSLLLARLFALASFGSVSDLCQMLQPDQAVGVLGHDAFRDAMIGVGFQPSLSSRNDRQAAGSRTSAFLLQTLPQSRRMVCPGNYPLSRMERMVATCIAGYSQVPNTNIYTSTPLVGFRYWIRYFDFKADQQVELLVGFVIPQPSSTNVSTSLDQGHVLVITSVGNDHSTFERQDADMILGLNESGAGSPIPFQGIGMKAPPHPLSVISPDIL